MMQNIFSKTLLRLGRVPLLRDRLRNTQTIINIASVWGR